MRVWMILPLILFFHLGSLIASAPSDWFLQPEELARLKNSGSTENVIHTKVEQQQLFLTEKWTQAQRFQFAPKVIPSADTGGSGWSIHSGSERLLDLRSNGGYLSTKTRAEVVARQLNRALLIGDGQFTSIQHNRQSAVEFQGSGARFIIISASEEDVFFSQSNTNRTAQKWAAILNLFWDSLPPVVLHSLPAALTLPDFVLLAKTGLSDRILLSFFDLRDIDRAVKAEQIKDIGFSKEVREYLARRTTVDVPDRMREWGYYGSRYCGYSSISISTTISFRGSGKAHFRGQQRGSRSPATRGSRGSSKKGSHAGVPGRTSNHNR